MSLSQFTTVFANGPGNVPDADLLMADFQHIRTYINARFDGSDKLSNPEITNAMISASAAILGSKLDTADGRLQLTTGMISGGTGQSLTTSYADLSLASATITPDVAAYLIGIAVFDFEIGSIQSGEFCVCDGTLTIDGNPSPSARLQASSSSTNLPAPIATVAQVYRIALPAAAHTVKLQAKKTETGTTSAMMGNQNGAQFLYALVAQ